MLRICCQTSVTSGREDELEVFRNRLHAAGLNKFADALVEMARPSARLVADPSMAIQDRSSRLGGLPDLPPMIEWPRNDTDPLSFIAQVNLADVAPYDDEALLPQDGLLSFFYDAVKQESWGFSPADHGSATVIYTDSTSATQRREAPADLANEGAFKAIGLRSEAELTFAPWESYDVEMLGMTREERFAYAELLNDQDHVIHRLLGHPDPVQGDMQVECQLVTNGLYCGDSSGYQDPGPKNLRPGAAEWRLLLQIDSQDDAGMMWGDVGRLYYWMKQAELVAGDWDLSWLILQCG